MSHSLLGSLSLIDASGYLIIAAILVLLVVGTLATFIIRVRYASLASELRAVGPERLRSPLLSRIVAQAEQAAQRGAAEVNTQAIIEHEFQSQLGGTLVAERFVKASTSLMIILGLVGTFYGLTLSIGKLAALVSSDVSEASEMTSTLTQGLVSALSGMSVAFSTSLVGIVAAILMTLLGVLVNVSERRAALMAQIESYIDNTLLASQGPQGAGALTDERLDYAVSAFRTSVAELGATVQVFQSALETFSANTRDFHEFNMHLKDNVQRMSLSFGDLSNTLRQQTGLLRGRDGR